jgi:hypothetical protein
LVEPLLGQLATHYRREDGTSVSEIVVVSPFFDAAAQAIAHLLTKFQPQSLSLFTQGHEHGLNPAKLKSILAGPPLQFQANQLDLKNRRLHAKALLVRTERGVWLATGSANMSRPAWLYAASSGNTEIVSLRFESDPTYFDAWLQELTRQASPIDLDEIEPPEAEPPSLRPDYLLTLLSATLNQRLLELSLSDSLPAKATLILHLAGKEIAYKRWQQQNDHTLILKLEADLLPQLEQPTLVYLEAQVDTTKLISNSVLLHNLAILERSRRPLDRRERPSIPEGMQPESYAHCAELLDMLYDLLATNSQQLRHHRRVIAAAVEKVQQEEKMVIEEDEYDPAAHFVPEEIRRTAPTSGADIYTDFYDRLTYEELLRAVLTAVYRPTPQPGDGPDPGSVTIPVPPSTPTPPPTNAEAKARLLARIEQGFYRLVDNFERGCSDEDYLDQIPPRYLIELLVIILAYLRIVWRDGMLRDELFIDCSNDLLTAFYGDLGWPGAWQTLRSRLTDSDLQDYEEHLALSAQTWLHTYILAKYLGQAEDADLYLWAAWVRYLKAELGSPGGILLNLPEPVYQRLWRFSLPASAKPMPASKVVPYLHELCRYYDEETLQAEINTWPGAKATVVRGTIANLGQVPKLQVRLPLLESNMELYWQTFMLFVLWPQPKQRAWVRFENTNPLEEMDDLESLLFFYRGDEQSLIFAARRKSGEFRPDITLPNISVEALSKVTSFAKLITLTDT